MAVISSFVFFYIIRYLQLRRQRIIVCLLSSVQRQKLFLGLDGDICTFCLQFINVNRIACPRWGAFIQHFCNKLCVRLVGLKH